MDFWNLNFFHLSNFQIFLLFFIPIASFSLLGYWLLAKRIEAFINDQSESRNEVVGSFLNILAMVFGIMLGLVAVDVWQKYDESERLVNKEATKALVLFRFTTGLPDTIRPLIQNGIREYISAIIHSEWPEARSGKVPLGGLKSLNKLQADLLNFHPQTDHQAMIYQMCLKESAELFDARRERIYATVSGLTPIVWTVAFLGIICTITITWFFRTTMRIHLVMSFLISVVTASILFMIASLDWPFRGSLGIPTTSYELSLDVMDRMMKENP